MIARRSEARTAVAGLAHDATQGWRELASWVSPASGRLSGVGLLSRVYVIGQAVLLWSVVVLLVDERTDLPVGVTWALATVLSAVVVPVIVTALLVWHARVSRLHEPAPHPRSRTRATVIRVTRLGSLVVLPAWVLFWLAEEIRNAWGYLASRMPAWFLAVIAINLTATVLRASVDFETWRGRLRQHAELRRARRMSDLLLRETARLATDDRLTPEALCRLLRIQPGEEPPEVFDAARTVLVARRRDPGSVRLPVPLRPREADVIMAVMSDVKRVWVDRLSAERRNAFGLTDEPTDWDR